MELRSLLEKGDYPKYKRGLSDEVFSNVMNFLYRYVKHGYNELDSEAVQFMDLDFKDKNCEKLFLIFCDCIGNLYNRSYMKIFISAEYDYIIVTQSLSEDEVVRLKALRKLIDLAMTNSPKTAMKLISELSIPMCSPDVYNYCSELCEKLLEK